MAWDDTPPDAPATTDAWDAAPPRPDELKPSYLSDVVSNAGKEIVNFPKSIPGTLEAALNLSNLPRDAIMAAPQMLSGTKMADTDAAKDIKPVIEGNKSTLNTIAHPIDSFRKAPINTLMTATGLLGGAKGVMGEMGGAKLPEAPLPESVPETPPVAPPEAPKGLPVVQPGAKTGAPHALFAYNDEFGPEGAPRSVYNVFGDPEHPAIKSIGHGSSVSKDVLDKAGIPVTGREPQSVGKFEPLEPPAGAPPEAPPAAEPKPPLTEQLAGDAAAKANEVKNYITRGYEGFSKKPGAIADVADYVQEKSQMMAAQQMGFTPLQNRQLGATPTAQLEAMRAIGQYGLDSDTVSPTGGLRHMVKTNERLLAETGKTLGDIRRAADKVRDPMQMPIDPIEGIRSRWDKVFAGAERSDEAAQYERALKIVGEHPATFEGMADAATALNKAANKTSKLNQPHEAFTDVANTLGQIENPRIRQLLPEKAAAYDQALKEFGINKKIESGLRRKVGGEVKRMGPGTMTSNIVQKALDEFGYRVGAKAANRLSTSIKKNPSIAGNLPSLFKEFANHVDETSKEVSGMYKGGTVPDDVKRYVSSRC